MDSSVRGEFLSGGGLFCVSLDVGLSLVWLGLQNRLVISRLAAGRKAQQRHARNEANASCSPGPDGALFRNPSATLSCGLTKTASATNRRQPVAYASLSRDIARARTNLQRKCKMLLHATPGKAVREGTGRHGPDLRRQRLLNLS